MSDKDDLFDTIGKVYAYAKEMDWSRAEFVKFLHDSQKDNIAMKIVEVDGITNSDSHSTRS